VSPAHEFLDHPGPIPFAHRGGSPDGQENSVAAFERAIDLGYRYLETDVRATADGVLIAFHDPTLDRVTDRTGIIERLPHAEVAKARIAGREPIPLLADMLGAWPGARFNIDVKAEAAIGPLTEVLRRTGAWGRVCVTSFSSRRLRHVRARMRLLSAARCAPRSARPVSPRCAPARSPGRWPGRWPRRPAPPPAPGALPAGTRATGHRQVPGHRARARAEGARLDRQRHRGDGPAPRPRRRRAS